MESSGRAFLADLRVRNDSLLAHHTMFQGIAAVMLGAGWWFKGLIELFQAGEGEVSGLVIFYIALPAIIIVALWVNVFTWLLTRFRTASRKHIDAVFEKHDIALMAMGNEFPESVRDELNPPQRIRARGKIDETHRSFARRIDLIVTKYPLIARGAGAQALPRGWAPADLLLIPLAAVCIFLLFALHLGPGQFLTGLTIVFGLIGIKHTLYCARLYAVRSVLVARLGTGEELPD